MAKRNLEYEHGYTMGYNWKTYEGGTISRIRETLYDRGILMNTVYAMGFKHGVIDASRSRPKKYDN